MKITDIKQQVKRADRYSIYADGKYAFSLSENELMTQRLHIGQEFSSQEFTKIKQTAVEDKAYMRALDLLARRQRSIWEIQQYLIRKEYDKQTIDRVLNKLSERGLLHDQKFAEAWVNNRRTLKNVSRRRLRQELQQKHVSNSVIDEVLMADDTSDKSVLGQLIQKKRTQSRYQDDQKLMAYLVRQGFNYSDIKEMLEYTTQDD